MWICFRDMAMNILEVSCLLKEKDLVIVYSGLIAIKKSITLSAGGRIYLFIKLHKRS